MSASVRLLCKTLTHSTATVRPALAANTKSLTALATRAIHTTDHRPMQPQQKKPREFFVFTSKDRRSDGESAAHCVNAGGSPMPKPNDPPPPPKPYCYAGGFSALIQSVRKLLTLPPGSEDSVVCIHHRENPESQPPGPNKTSLGKSLLSLQEIFSPPEDPTSSGVSHFHFHILNFKGSSPLLMSVNHPREMHTHAPKRLLPKPEILFWRQMKKGVNFCLGLNEKIGEKVFEKTSRIYCSTNGEKIVQLKGVLDRAGIPYAGIKLSDVTQKSLLKQTEGLHVLEIFCDGRFSPDAAASLVKHFQEKYPEQFTSVPVKVSEVVDNTAVSQPHKVIARDDKGTLHKFSVKSFHFSSKCDNFSIPEEDSFSLHPAPNSAVTTTWRGTFPRSDGPIGTNGLTLPMEDGSLLNITPYEVHEEGDQIVVSALVTQAAHKDPATLELIEANLNRFVKGTWEVVACCDPLKTK